MARLRGVAAVAVPLAIAALELLHPTWPDAMPAEAVAAAGGWWIALHLALVVGYALLVGALWPFGAPGPRLGRIALAAFLVANTAFLALDGLGVGLLAPTEPAAANALWNSLLVGVLANLTGATWAAALLALAAARAPEPRLLNLALFVTWLLFVASAAVPLVGFASLGAAIAIAAWRVFQSGSAGLPFALMLVAAMLHQHVGPEATVGMLCIAMASVNELRSWAPRERSTPGAWSPP